MFACQKRSVLSADVLDYLYVHAGREQPGISPRRADELRRMVE